MFKQIRKLLDENTSIFTYEVEIDETYIGGRKRGARGPEGKTAVIGIAERHGSVISKVITNAKRSTVMPLIKKNVAQKTIIYTDEAPVYNNLDKIGYRHEEVNHSN